MKKNEATNIVCVNWLKSRICFSTMSKFSNVQTYNAMEWKRLLQKENRTQTKRARVTDMVT